MTFEMLRDIATRKGTVRWTASGIVEHLRLHKKGFVIARKVKDTKEHRIKTHDDGYRCIEVARDSRFPSDHPEGFVPTIPAETLTGLV